MAEPEASNPEKQPSVTQNPGLVEHIQHKNRLHAYVQRHTLPLPLYETINEGYDHAPQFRSTVSVDGQKFTTSERFFRRKEAEQAVAKFALENISMRIEQEVFALIHGDTTFCKSILHEYAAKMSIEAPKYTTSPSVGLLPAFVSSVDICQKTYTGGPAKSKKEAEQIAARAAIESILGHPSTRTLMTDIIKLKGKLYASIYKGSGTDLIKTENVVIEGNMRNNLVNFMQNTNEPAAAEIGQLENEKVKLDYTCEPTSFAIGGGLSLPQLEADPLVLQCQPECIASSSGNKRHHNNELESPVKRIRNDGELQSVLGT